MAAFGPAAVMRSPRHGAGNRFAFLALVAGVWAVSSVAHAEDCYALTQAKTRVEDAMVGLVADYPGTHLVIGMCGAAAQGSSDPGPNFGMCAVGACALVGFDNCIDVVKKWASLGVQKGNLEQRMLQSRCP